MPDWLTLPNILTIFRMGLTPCIGYWIAIRDYRTALPVLFIAGISDAFDGYLARRFNWQSKLGGRLDPIADKFLTATVFLALAANGALPWWMVALVFGRDLMILAFAAWALRSGIRTELPPTFWGKLSTMLQMLLGGGAVLHGALELGWLEPVVSTLLWSSAAMTIWSGIHYGWIGSAIVTRHRRSLD